MGNTNKQICRLCLELILDGDCEVIEESKKEILDTLLIKIDFDISNDAVACKRCLGKLQDCFDFKSTCFYMNDYVTPFVDADVKVDIKNVFENVTMTSGNVSLDNSQMCRLCMSFIEDEAFNCYTSDLKDMIGNCFPKVNLNSVDEPLVCKSCLSNITRYYAFMKSCKEVEQKIKDYIQKVEDHGIANKVILKDVLELIKCDSLSKPIRKQWLDVANETECLKNEEAANIKCEEIEIKDELDIRVEASEAVKSGNDNSSAKNGSLKKRKIQKSNTKGKKMQMYKCEKCSLSTKYKKSLINHQLLHKNPEEILKHKCGKCEFETHYKNYLTTHMLRHENSELASKFQCEKCPYRCKWQGQLVKHMVIHPNICAFSCDQCTYSSNYKPDLQRHKRVHQKEGIREMYKCELCDYQAKTSVSIKNHMITIHTDPSKLLSFQCALCPYKGTLKKYLFQHISRCHRDPPSFKCTLCLYMTNEKTQLKRHSVIHQEAHIIKCDQCDFRAKYRRSLRRHMLVHASVKPPVLKCDKCKYSTMHKDCFSQHKLRHMELSETIAYKCAVCGYQTKYKTSLRNHVKTCLKKKNDKKK